MMKLVTTLLASALLLTSAAAAQNPQQNELPSAPMPHFPGAPLQQPAKAPAAVETAPQLTTLPPANAPAPVASHTPTTQPPPVNTQPATAAQTPAQNAPAAEPTMQASSTAPPADEGEFRIGVEVNLVNLIFTATDKRGHLIKDLKQSDIRLLDQGKPPESIKAFQSETGLPLQVGLLIDASNSIRDRFRFEQEAAAEFLNQVVRTESDKAFVIGFDSVADLTQDFTSDKNALGHGVRVLRAGGGTALHDAVYMACEKLAKAPVQNSARRALRAEVIIYVINTDVSDMNQKGDKVLMRYAEATGGRVLNPLRIEDVTNAFNQIQDELRSQYVLAYKPGDFVANGSYRSITLDVPKRSNIKVRVRKGYYAPKGS
jgi:VWA domain-containing protein